MTGRLCPICSACHTRAYVLPEDLLALFCHSLPWQSAQWDELEAFQILGTLGGRLATKTLLCSQHCVLPPAGNSAFSI